MEEVRIVADTENNSLLIWATSQNYERIISTLQKMDVTPRQVLIEATIAEVTLTGQLQYGLQWFFEQLMSAPTMVRITRAQARWESTLTTLR
ncbi:MAG: hypothetical protein MZW92_09320 [Comamonadaceae bacterium]|nr:hypothetical protein [Comamonadaceae bacterium]